MTDDEIRAIRERADKASLGPWKWKQSYEVRPGIRHWAIVDPASEAAGKVTDHRLVLFYSGKDAVWGDVSGAPNLQFIAASRTDVPALADECLARGRRIAELEAEVERLKQSQP